MRDLVNTELMRRKLTVSMDAAAAVESETKKKDIVSNNLANLV